MDMTQIHSLWTLIVLVTFIGIIFWAFSKKRRSSFDEASRLPLEDEQVSSEKGQNSGRENG